jgi:glycosyltransferase involved in cell wall biosynthesis
MSPQGSARVSVIMPVFNTEAYIAESIESVLQQSFEDLELIVVDDGSTDASADIAREAAARDPRVRVLAQQNAGVSVARNHGLADARGSYISLIDADDLWHQDKIRLQLEVIDGSTTRCVLTGLRRFHCRGENLEWGYATEAPPLSGREYELRTLLTLEKTQMSLITTALMPTVLARQLGGWTPGLWIAEDWDFWLKARAKVEFIYIPDHLYYYRKHVASATRQHRLLDILNQQEEIVIHHAREGLADHNILSEALFKCRMDACAIFLYENDLSGAAKALFRACRDPRVWNDSVLWKRGLELIQVAVRSR